MEEPSLTSGEDGYYPVKKGETFNGRYHVVQNLGYGYFSTVWLCQDAGKKRCVAVKVPKGGENFAEAALDEVMLLRYVNSKRRKDRGSDYIIHLLDDFKMIGENGFHVCLVMELLGPSLQTVLSIRGSQGLPLPFVKKAMRQILQGLHFLHKECRIIHTDIKPDNILLYVTEESLHNMVSLQHSLGVNHKSRTGDGPAALLDCGNLMKMGVKIADLGSACWTYKPFSKKIQTQPYRAVEVLLGLDYSTPADIWSAACLAFELATGKHLFKPQASQHFSRDDDHVALIIELLGKIPPKIALLWQQTSTFFSRQGALLRMSWISFYDLHHILVDKYSWPKPQATHFTSFVLPMLEYAPERRARAEKCLQHPWLSH
ncbi:SRSF protein kinase 3-like [Pituophis catenifer annectens]|uniref:SRSF protein kinase 3-like n=1 Tax=Pituophis catenifer annectens TaxID=94852 RepID=UPI003995ACA1